ncbi:spore coat protein [Firmicutes bacterium CAG:449]|nr:spore coat protein [Firmicutes bacterium CAG:449]
MRAFLYDKYGYYPDEEYSTSFTYQGWFFKLEISEKNDYELASLKKLLNDINNSFQNLGSDIVLTRDGHYVTTSEYGPVVLVAIKEGKVTIDTLFKMHQMFYNQFQNQLTVSYLRNLWLNKINTIEERIIPSLPNDNKEFSSLYILSMYALGSAENAIQYLLDIIYYYGNEIKNTSLVHKRIDELNSFYLFNPFNLIIDSPMRDLAELYKNDLLSLEQLYDLLKRYPLTSLDASLLLARCLYPNQIFDLLEDYYELKKDITNRVNQLIISINSKEFKLKKLHKFLVSNYQIRPISWLDK